MSKLNPVIAAALAATGIANVAAATPLEFGRKDAGGSGGIDAQLARALGEVQTFAHGAKAKMAELGDRMDSIEVRAARGGQGPHTPFTAGSQFVRDEMVQEFLKQAAGGSRGRIGVEVKAIISSLTTDANGSAGDLLTPDRDAIYIPQQRRLVVRDLLPVVQISSGAVEVVKRTGFTNAAATVAEGGTKPQSELKYDKDTVTARTIAHWVLASRQILEDIPQLQGLIDTDLRYGLAFVEDVQLLSGSGAGEDLNGIYTQATAFTQAASGLGMMSAATKLDVIGAALLQNALANEPATGIVLHPSDWTDMRLLKDTEGRYLMGPPGADVVPRLFGLPVVATPAMTVDKFLVGNFQAATLYDRWQARVEVSTEDSDNFRKNLVTVLAEERIGLAVKNTAAFTKGDFSDAITDLTS
jgi:HK97 family phage major capsid protein